MNYVFDIDGTLTPSRLPINKEFEKFFLEWMEEKNVYFVTGSDKDKTVEQIGEKIWKKATRCYQSCGNAVYENGKLIKQLDFKLDKDLKSMLTILQFQSDWTELYDNHIEERIGLINFSVIGRTCPQDARERYHKWDEENQERKTYCDIINSNFPKLEATIGGQISIDIYPKGKNKAQILDDLEDVTFFGDKCGFGGNDFPIVERLHVDRKLGKSNRRWVIHDVTGWEKTFEILKGIK